MMKRKKSEGYMYGGSDCGSYFCRKCGRGHHKLSELGKEHKVYSRV